MHFSWLPTKEIWKFMISLLANLETKIQDVCHGSIKMVWLLYIMLPTMDTLECANLSLKTLLIKIQHPSSMMVIHHFIWQLPTDTWKFVNLLWLLSSKNPANTSGDFTPFHEAATGGRFKSMLRQIRNQYQLEDVTVSNHLEICKLFIANIADKNPSTQFGLTPLGVAALCGQLEICFQVVFTVRCQGEGNW